MKRLYIPTLNLEKNVIINDITRFHYVKNVLRAEIGDKFLFFNEGQGEWLVEIKKIAKKEIFLETLHQTREPLKTPFLGLAFGVIKHQALSWMVEKATELGVSDLYPLITDHSQKISLKVESLMTTITDAAQQCERLDLPTLHPVSDLKTFLKLYGSYDIRIACERQKDIPPLSKLGKPAKPYIYMVGPEGGWSETENKLFEPCLKYNLGANVLRAETAALSTLAIHHGIILE